jgi:AcrR family transcriptional regulator
MSTLIQLDPLVVVNRHGYAQAWFARITMHSRAVTPKPPGLREQGRTDRLRRLHEAALAVFRSRGYDAATTREIAQVARVAVGTVFVHAKDKRDLLFLVINDDLDEVLQRSLVAMSLPGPVLDQLMALIGPIYAYFASDPKLARAALREAVYFDIQDALSMGEQAQRYVRRMDAWMAALTNLLNGAKQAAQLRLEVPAALMARILWDLHLVQVRRWMAKGERPVEATGQAQLRRIYTVVLNGRHQSD